MRLEEGLPPGWVAQVPEVMQRVLHYRHHDFQLVWQDVDAQRVYACYIEARCGKPISLPFQCETHDLYMLCQLEGQSHVYTPNRTSVLELAAGEYQLPYSPPAPYVLRLGKGTHRLLFFALRASWLARYRHGSLTGLGWQIEALISRQAQCIGGNTNTLCTEMEKAIHDFLHLESLSGLALDTGVEEPLVRLIDRHLNEARTSTQVQEASYPPHFKRITAFVNKQIASGEVPNAVQLGERFGYSRQGLYLLFKRHVHMGIRDYIHGLRMQLALVLLREQKLPATEVAIRLHYGDYASFAKQFHAYYGTYPRAAQTMAEAPTAKRVHKDI